VKLLETNENAFTFYIGKREKQLLIGALHLYPLLNPDYHNVTRGVVPKKLEHAQQLLAEAMAEQKKELKAKVAKLIQNPEWLAADKWTLKGEEMEWLLQVLNDVQVGSWVLLGRPDPHDEKERHVDDQHVHYAIALEICGIFEMILLEALQGG
jgi:hypothetical protein